MTSADTVIDALLAVERQLAELRDHRGVLASAFGLEPQLARFRPDQGRLAPPDASTRSLLALTATANLYRVLETLATTIDGLVTQVSAFDRELHGDEVESLGELAIRAEALAILLQLDRLIAVFVDSAAHARAPALWCGRFRAIDDVVSFVLARLAGINRTWLRYRRIDAQMAATLSPEPTGARKRGALHRCAVRDAQRSIMAMGCDPDLARFLDAGMALDDWPDVQRPCAALATLLSITITADVDLAGIDVAEPDRTADAPRPLDASRKP